MAVPNIFANVTTTIPLSQLDTNFATAITLGNTAVYLGNTTTALGNLTLNNVTIASGTASGNLSTGNVTVSGTLGVTGATTLSSTLAAGNTTITGTLSTSAATAAFTGLQVGTGGGANAGWILGNQASTVAGIWNTGVTPSATNYSLASTASTTYINGSTGVDLYANNGTVATIRTTGLAVTGTLSATGAISTTDTTASSSTTTGALKVSGGAGFAKGIVVGSSSNRGTITLTGTSGAGPAIDTFDNQTGGKNIAFGQGINAAGEFDVYNTTDNVNMLRITSAGVITTANNVAVTGTLSATSTLSTIGGALKAEAAASQAKSTVGAFNSGSAAASSAEILTFAQAGTQKISHFWANSTTAYQIQTLASGAKIQLMPDTGGTVVADVTSTGVAVTGATVAAFKVNSSRADAVYCQDGDNNTAGQIDLKNTGAASGNFMVYRNSASTVAGTISHSGSTTVAYNTSSDYRLKENVKPMEGALEKVSRLKPVTYTWIEDKTPGEGFIAHELQEISPNCVTGEKDGLDKDGSPLYQGVDVSFLVATLTAAIQELAAKVAKLEAAQAAPQVEKTE